MSARAEIEAAHKAAAIKQETAFISAPSIRAEDPKR
jgi:hypothetical protein